MEYLKAKEKYNIFLIYQNKFYRRYFKIFCPAIYFLVNYYPYYLSENSVEIEGLAIYTAILYDWVFCCCSEKNCSNNEAVIQPGIQWLI